MTCRMLAEVHVGIMLLSHMMSSRLNLLALCLACLSFMAVCRALRPLGGSAGRFRKNRLLLGPGRWPRLPEGMPDFIFISQQTGSV